MRLKKARNIHELLSFRRVVSLSRVVVTNCETVITFAFVLTEGFGHSIGRMDI